jgi:para-nitrobenzyl esterase
MAGNNKAIVEIQSGKIEGIHHQGLYLFNGVPYAAPPVGSLRWMPPQPAAAWNGIRPAKEYGPIAPQTVMPAAAMNTLREEQPQSEDCLSLNIRTPGLDNAKRPVMVWIHGGAFNMGSGSEPNAEASKLSARGDVVIVSINYRLGLLGFLNLNEVTGGKIPSTGNEGLLDQVAALRWVRDTIAVFGGDPNNVTVFGESAGAMSIGCLLAMPAAKGLFQKAILESGVGSTVSYLDAGVMLAEKFLKELGIPAGDTDALQSVPVERLLQVNQALKKQLARKNEEDLRITVTAPVIDGTVIPDSPLEMIRNGSAAGVHVLAGTNYEEWKLLCMTDFALPKLDEAGLVKRLDYYLPAGYSAGLVGAYRKARSARGEDTSVPELLKAIQTDRMFRMPCLKTVEAQSHHNPETWNYLFTWKSPALEGMLGACHALDIGFVFGNLEPAFNGTGPEAERLSLQMQDAWLSFARTGNPACESIGEWKPYGTDRNTMVFGRKSHQEPAPYEEERKAWEAIPEFFTGEIRVEPE